MQRSILTSACATPTRAKNLLTSTPNSVRGFRSNSPAEAKLLHGILGAAIAYVIIVGPIVLPCYLVALKRATGLRICLLANAAFPPLAAASIAPGLAWFATLRFERPILELIIGMTVGGLCYLVMAAPQLIFLFGYERAAHPQVKRVLRIYYKVGRTVGTPMGPPPRHAVRGRARHLSSAYWM